MSDKLDIAPTIRKRFRTDTQTKSNEGLCGTQDKNDISLLIDSIKNGFDFDGYEFDDSNYLESRE